MIQINPQSQKSRPVWWPYAFTLISLLRRSYAGPSTKTDMPNTADDTATAPDLDSMFAGFTDGSGDDLVSHATDPIVPIPGREILTAIRLAAALGSPEAARSIQQQGAMTVMRDIMIEDFDTLLEVLTRCFRCPTWVMVVPSISEGAVSASANARFHRQIADAAESIAPVLILQTEGTMLPEHLTLLPPRTLRLPPIGADILIARLRAGQFSGDLNDETGFRAALPPDSALANLSTLSALTAFRASSLQDIIQRLKDTAKGTTASGPMLEELEGNSKALDAARRLIADLRLWQQGKVGWNEISHSLLLYGPPGTGKTWIASAMGKSAGVTFVSASFAAWQSAGHLGDLLREMRKSFAEARRLAPTVMFIDEIDSVGSRLGSDRQNRGYRTQVINCFLAEMDSITREEGVIVIGACNYPDRIDAAVLRAGRFDTKIEVPLPNAEVLLGMLRASLRTDLSDAELRDLARASVGRSPAEVDAAIRAARSAARHTDRAFNTQLLRQHLGIEQTRFDLACLRRYALHEVGHALVGTSLGLGLIKEMMVHADGGRVLRQTISLEGRLCDIDAEITYFMAGRAAEQLMLGDVSAGAGGTSESDLARATDHALAIETRYGLGSDGPVWTDAAKATLLQDRMLRGRVRKRIDAAERRARDILEQQRDLLEDMARELLQQRSLTAAEIAPFLNRVVLTDTGPKPPFVPDGRTDADSKDSRRPRKNANQSKLVDQEDSV